MKLNNVVAMFCVVAGSLHGAYAQNTGGQDRVPAVVTSYACSEWNSRAMHMRIWLNGYLMSAYSLVGASGKLDGLKDMSVDQIHQWMDVYCRSHPGGSLAKGANLLVVELINQAKR